MPIKFLVFFSIVFSSALSFAQAENTDQSKTNPWEGFYASGSYSSLNSKLTSYSNNSYNGDDTSQTVINKSSKASMGLQLGHNWQFDSIIAGLEIDIGPNSMNQSSCRGVREPGTPCGDWYFGTLNLTSETKYQGAFLGKLGHQFDDFMFYISGGLVYLKSKNIMNVDCPSGCGATDANPLITTTTVSKNKLALAYGVGGEYMLDKNWRLGVDYLYFKSPHLSQSLTHDATYGPQVITSTNSNSNSLLRAKLIYAF